jgi:uncharacterized alpha-E superfamily protein
MGRRVERLAWLTTALQVATREGRTHSPNWLLMLADSSVTYRSRYQVAPEWLPVLDMLVRDPSNPRSLAFQMKGLCEYAGKIESSHGHFVGPWLMQAQNALHGLAVESLHPDDAQLARFLDQLQKAAYTLSDELTLKFFSHASSRSVLSLVA